MLEGEDNQFEEKPIEEKIEKAEKAQPYENVDFEGVKKVDEHDELPIGKKSAFNWDEYPPDGGQPPVAKKPVLKSKKKGTDKTIDKIEKNDKPPINIDDMPLPTNAQQADAEGNKIDDIPVGGGKKFEISEYPEGEQAQEGEQQQLPIPARLKSKAWKLRQSAFEEMAELFNDGQQLDEYFEEWPKLLNDNNPGSQEKALQAFLIFIKKCNKKSLEQRLDGKETVRVLIDKCIAPGKTNIKKLGLELLFDIFEKRDKVEMFDVLNEMLKNKVQKVQCAAIQSLIELLITFGPKRLDFLKPFFPEIEKLAQSTTSSVKQECMNLYKEAFKWLGEQVLASYIKGLKKLQLEELEKFQKEWQQIPMQAVRGGDAVTIAGPSAAGLDAYDVVDAVDIFNKYNEKWCDKVLAQSKWNEKCALLDQLIKDCQSPKIAPGNYSPMLSLIKKLLQDSNANINLCTIKLCGLLAKGLRKNFTNQAKLLFPLLTPKLRDKKTLMIDETRLALEMMHYSIYAEDVVEDFKEAIVDKNPQMRVSILNLFAKLVQLKGQQNKQKYTDMMKQLLPMIKKLLEDSVPDVREATVQCLGNLKGQLSEQLLQQFYQDLGQKANKINEIAQALEDQKKQKQAELNPPQKKQEEPKQQNSEKKDLKQSQVQERPQSSKQLKEEPVPQKQQQGKKIQLEEEQEPSLEALQNILRDAGVEDSFFELMNGTPKQKAEGIQQLENYIDAMLYQFDAVLYFLKAKLKDWKEANLAINKELFAMLIYANDLDPRPFNKKSFPPLCKLIIEKITETRFKEDIQTIIRGSCESVSPKLVVIYLISQTQSKEDKNQKVKDVPPKTIGEIILQIVKIVDLVTMRYLPFRELLEFGKEQIQQINPVIKQASQELLKTLYRFIGQDLIAHLQDLPPLTLKALAAEFDKIAPQMNQESQLQFQGEAASEIIQAPQIANPIDQLPRQDISVPIQGIIKKLSDVQWNKRKEAVEELDRLLTQNGNRVQMNGLTELFGLLKSRLSDNNKGVIRAIIQITGRLAEACGKEFKNQGKQLICPLITLLSDKQVLVRQDVVASLEKIGVSIGADQVVSQFPPYLGQESSELKQDLLQYMLNHPDGLVKSETKQFILPLLNNLCDRVKETRQLAEQVIEKVIDDIGVDPFVNATKDMKPAVVQQIKQFLSKFGIDADDGRQRTGRTPKNKLNQSEKIPERKMKQSMTTKDLTSELNTSQEIRKERNERTPKKSMHQKSHKTLPQDTPSKAKPVFMDNNIIASQISVRELKLLRIQSDSVTNWVNETFPNQDLSDLQYYLKEDVHQLLFNYNYRENIKGLNAVKNACIQTLSKMDVIEMSDLLLKYILFKLYGQIVNPTILICLIQFIDQYLKILVTANYKFNEIESTIIVLILREIIYCNYDIQVDLIASIEKLTKPYLFLQRIINILKLNHQIVHQHLNNQKPRIDQQVCFVILQLSKYFDESLVQEFIQTGVQSKEVVQELQNIFGEQIFRKFGMANQQQIQITNQQQPQQAQPVQVQKDPRDQYFQQLLDSLLSQSTSSKIESLMQINDLLTQNLQQNQQLFVDHADQICKCFHNLLSSIFTNRDNYPAQFIQFFLAALTRLYQVKPYVKALPYDLLCSFTEELIQRLLAEDEIKQQYDQGDNTVKQLNATTLRILENTNFDLIFGILFDTMIKYRRRNHQSKMVGLLLKCITRIAAKLDQNANQIRFDLMILKFHNFLSEFSVSPNFSLDEQAVKTIKVVLQQLVKLKGESIWEVYQIVERSNSQDQFLSKWIQAFLANIQYQPTQTSMPESQLMNNTQNKEDQELKEIQDLLNKPQFLEIGINKLVDKIRKNPNLNWTKYVKDTQIQLLVQQQLVPQMQPNDPRALRTQQRGSQDVSAQQQQGQLKTPEYLMQKLNDMKNKVQTLVGTQPQQQYRK